MKRFSLSAAAIWLATAVLADEWKADPNFSIGLKQPYVLSITLMMIIQLLLRLYLCIDRIGQDRVE